MNCGKQIDGRNEAMFADLDGPAFKAYYHAQCLPAEEVRKAAAEEQKTWK
jgi:hypothetical protein